MDVMWFLVLQTEKKNEGSESLYSHKKGKVAKTKQQVMIGPWQSVNIDGKRAVRVDAFTSFYFETFTFCWRISRECGISWPVEMSKSSRIQEVKATSIQVSASAAKISKYWFSVFCNVGRRPGGLCWIKWATLLLWRHNCDTRAVQTISHTSVIRSWPPLAGRFESHSSLKRILALHF